MAPKDERLFEREDAPARRRPSQARAEQTVERIKRAMLELIDNEGYAAASTNRIAEHAKVNIASLYRYFPNRQSIALALYESASAGLARLTHDWLTANMSTPVESGMKKLVILIIDYVDREQVALLRLRDEVPELRERTRPMSLETLAYHPSRLYLERQLGPIDNATMNRKMFFVQNLGMGLIRQFVLDRPPGLSKAQFAAELTNLIIVYLRSPAAARA
ncbi:MAG: TetR/AcrR family transcriptional regulator [Panacagrimonas sp.]